MTIANTALLRTHNATAPQVRSVGDAPSSQQSRHLHQVLPQTSAASPTLDSLAQNPQLALLLSPEDAAALALSCAAVMAVLQHRSLTPVSRLSEDRIINAEELGQLLGKKKRWVEGHLDELPSRRSILGNPSWLLSEVENWMRKTPRYGRAA